MRAFLSVFCASLCLSALPATSGTQGFSHVWSHRFGDGDVQYPSAVATDASDNIVVMGDFYGSVDFGGGALTSAGVEDVFVARFDANGNHLWSLSFGDADDQYAAGVAVDASGNVIMIGTFYGTMDFGGGPLTSVGGSYDVFLAKFDAAGNHLWSKRYGDANDDLGGGVATDGSGNIFVIGDFWGTIDFGGGAITSGGYFDVFVARLDPDGNHVWSRGFGDTTLQEGRGIAVDGSDHVVVTGFFHGSMDFGGGPLTSAGSADIFVARFDASGNHLWSQNYGDENEQYGLAVATDASNNMVVTGYYWGGVDFGGGVLTSAGLDDIYVVSLDPTGNHNWSRRFGDAAAQFGRSVAIDGSGNVVVTGEFSGTADFGGGVLTSAGAEDIYIAAFDAAGNHIQSQRFGDAGSQYGSAVAIDGSGEVVATGHFASTVDLGGGVLTSAGADDIFVAKFSQLVTGVGDHGPPAMGSIAQNYPNPFSGSTDIAFELESEARVRIGVYDVRGRLVRNLVDGRFSPDRHVVVWDGRDDHGHPAAGGVYFYRLESGSRTQTRKMVRVR